MKTIVSILFCLSLLSFAPWQTDFEAAKRSAAQKHQLILLNFSGSDWCAPCIRMKRDIFGSESFSKMADSTLVLVNADFPRNKKNQPAEQVKKQNEQLADKYDPEGKFPFTLLLDADGKVLKAWEGEPSINGAQFAAEVKSIADAYNKQY